MQVSLAAGRLKVHAGESDALHSVEGTCSEGGLPGAVTCALVGVACADCMNRVQVRKVGAGAEGEQTGESVGAAVVRGRRELRIIL